MIVKNGKASDVQIAYIGGGSRGWAWTFMTDLALEDSLSGTIRLYDIDRPAAEANEKIGNHLMSRDEAKGDWKFTVKESLEDALTGADFVVISILPGTFDEMEVDVHMPERLGIYQSVGDTAGPGGIIRAMRTIPMFVEIAEAIQQYSPEAWVINYTNPMAVCVRTLYEVFPGIKAFGCCHEVFGTQQVLKTVYEKEIGETVSDFHDVKVNVVGVNHFTWFTEASCYGQDLFELYRHYAENHFEEGLEVEGKNWMNSSFFCANRVKMDLFLRYGNIAAAGDRHLAEFMPGSMYLKDPETVKSWKFGLTSAAWRKNDLKERLARSRRLLNGEEEIRLESTGEEGIALIKALCGLTRMISNVNIPNFAAQIPNLDQDAVVETNAVFSRDSIRPVFAGNLPESIEPLIVPHAENQKLILKAAMHYDRDCLYQAFLNDPLMKGYDLKKEDLTALADDMLEGTKAYLPKEWFA